MVFSVEERGFTLVELIVVMVMISLTASFAMPRIRSTLFTNQLTSAVRRFVGLVAETAQEARLKRTSLVLRFDRERHLFTAGPVQDNGMDDERKYQRIRVDESVQVVDIESAHSDKESKFAGGMAIRFSSRGYTDKTAVRFRHENGDEMSVILSPFLGMTRILEGSVFLADDRLTLNR